MSWYLYIAEARTGKYYVGITTEPARRINDHNNGRGSRMAKNEGPFTLIYTSKPLADQSTARKWEMQVKRWKRDKKEKLIKGEIAGNP
ncbi:MAG: GIY-YIG nuclease family protein [Candidatus Andersenbacteria bacterium]